MSGSSHYKGRFAPSPSGPLHFGSLIAALASYLDAQSHQGQWLVRIEDIDEPRTVAGADSQILKTLETHGLQWDGDVVYQSKRKALYQAVLAPLLENNQVYHCTCTRKKIKEAGGVYPGMCRTAHHSADHAAIRLKLDSPVTHFHDRILGDIRITDPHALEDTVLKRRDGYFAYNLVVVADDIEQGITHIVRGSDLLPTTAAHLSFYQLLKQPAPEYAHLPVASVAQGRKLSKQNHAAALDNATPVANLIKALHFLNLAIPDEATHSSVNSVLQWATEHWHCDNIPKIREIIVAAQESTYHTNP